MTPYCDDSKNETVLLIQMYAIHFVFHLKIAVKIVNTKKDMNKWMNHIRIQSSIERHENVIQFFGFRYSERFAAILMENANTNLIDQLKMMNDDDTFRNQQTFFNFFTKSTLDILNGMVRRDFIFLLLILAKIHSLKMFINENEIIHRNLKAENILISEDGTTKVGRDMSDKF